MAEVKIKNVCKCFAKDEVISNLSLEIPHGEFVVFVGPSGCGKSTTLRMIAGLEDVSAGRIELDGEDVTDTAAAKRGVAMVFQSYALFPHMTVAANIGFGLRLRKVERTVMDEKVKEVANILQITELLERYPRELSGGQRQRVAIGRAIIRDPKVFLFDEPLSNLDATLRVQMRLEIARLHSDLEATMIYVTHDQVEAMTLAERIVVLNHGKVEQVGTPMDLYDRPANRFVAGFIGAPRMNFLKARQTKGELDIDGCRLPHRIDEPSTEVTEVGIRPEHLMPTDVGDAAFVGAVELIERLGAETYAYIRVPGITEYLTVRLPGKSALAIHQTVGLNPDWIAMHLFSSSGMAV